MDSKAYRRLRVTAAAAGMSADWEDLAADLDGLARTLRTHIGKMEATRTKLAGQKSAAAIREFLDQHLSEVRSALAEVEAYMVPPENIQ
jgi:hypothetical protein